MARAIARHNQFPYAIGGILIDGANINGTTYIKELYIIQQRSDIVYDLVDASGTVYTFVTMTYRGTDSRMLDASEDDATLVTKIPKNTFYAKVFDEDDNLLGFMTRILYNIVKISDGSSADFDLVLNRTPAPPIVPVTGVTLSQTTLAAEVGGPAVQLTATIAPVDATNQNVTWSSDDSAVATVSSTGLVTIVNVGQANITVTTEDGVKTAICVVTVTNPTP